MPSKVHSAKITSKNQLTLPGDLVAQLGVRAGDSLRLAGAGVTVAWNLSREIWRAAGEANARYAARRRRAVSSDPRRIAADFIIGAHAAIAGAFLTSEAALFKRNFPGLNVLVPPAT